MAHDRQLCARFLHLVDRFETCRMAVIGDLIADQFLYGRIARVSREAPVLVLQYRNLVQLPGGAANAANNLLALDCRTSIVGAIGFDPAGESLVAFLKGRGADVSLVARVADYATPVKTRILAGAHHSAPQQVVRVDREAHLPGAAPVPGNRLGRMLGRMHGIILSDYGYGAVAGPMTEAVRRAARQKRIPLVVDSRFRMDGFHGVTSMTPNITELEAAAGIDIGGDAALLHKVARRVLKRQDLESVLVTQGRFGMTLIQSRRAPVQIPVYGTDEVADVTGAGDTVIAVFTLALACGASHPEAARLANYAGGIVVMKRGTATVNREELRAAITRDLAG